MIQILPELKELNSHLKFMKIALTKCGFRHVTSYINGLIALNSKSIKAISKNSLNEKDHHAIQKLLQKGKFDLEQLEKRYLKKLKYLFKGKNTNLIFDDTLHQRFGKKVEGAQLHKDHCTNGFINAF